MKIPLVAALGSSSVSGAYFSDASNVAWTELGWVTWLARLCPQIRISREHTFGYSGATSDTLRANAQRVVDASPRAGYCLVGITPNDADTLSVQASIDNYIAICTLLLAADIVPILVVQHPRSDWSGNPAWRARQLARAAWANMRAPHLIRGVHCVDISTATADLAATTFSPKSGLVDDTVHLNHVGHYLAARVIKATVDRLIPDAGDPLAVSAEDIWSTNNPTGSLTQNPTMTGTGGTKSGSNATGTVADGYTLAAQTNLAVAASIYTDPATGALRQRLAVSGAVSGDGFVIFDAAPVSGALAALAVNDRVEMAVQYSVSGNMTGFRQCGIRWTPTVTGFATINYRDCNYFTGTRLMPYAHTAILRAPPQPVLGPVTAAVPRFFIDCVDGVTTDFIVDVGPFTVRRLSA